MKNLKVQRRNGVCGIYNLANVTRDADILKYEDQEEFIPCGVFEANKILQLENYPYRISNIAFTPDWNFKIPKDFAIELISGYESKMSALDSKNRIVMPFLLAVQRGSTKYTLHATTLMAYKGKYIYSDPVNDRFERLESLESLFDKFNYINQIKILEIIDSGCFAGYYVDSHDDDLLPMFED